MVYEPRIATIIASKHLLRELGLHDIGSRVLAALHRLQSSLDKIGFAGCTPCSPFTRVSLLRTWWTERMNLPLPIVYALSLRDCDSLPPLDVFGRVFPNVVQLGIGPEIDPRRAMGCLRPVAITINTQFVGLPGYGELRDLFAHTRNSRLRCVTIAYPNAVPRLYDWLPRLQGEWVSHRLLGPVVLIYY